MAKIGLIAGGGSLPLEFLRSARRRGETVVVFAIREMAPPGLEEEADRVYHLEINQYRKILYLSFRERVRRLAMVGKIEKAVIFDRERQDAAAREDLNRVVDKKDYTILEEWTRRLKRVGVEVIDGREYLGHLLPEGGVLGRVAPDERVTGDMRLGFETAKKVAAMDVGQVVVVKDRAVVAVEAMEGTDATIERARSIAGEGCVMVKVSRPAQDMRWDVPTVGPDTIARLAEHAFSGMAIESGGMFFLERERAIRLADESRIAVRAF